MVGEQPTTARRVCLCMWARVPPHSPESSRERRLVDPDVVDLMSVPRDDERIGERDRLAAYPNVKPVDISHEHRLAASRAGSDPNAVPVVHTCRCRLQGWRRPGYLMNRSRW